MMETTSRHKKINPGRTLITAATLLMVAALIFAILFSGCSMLESAKGFLVERFSNEKHMEAAVETVDIFFELLMKKDYDGAYEYISSADKNSRSRQDFVMEFDDVTDIVDVEINQVEIKNNISIVNIDIIDSYDGEKKMYKDIEVSLIKEEDENWRIVFWK
jgi:hypothetical protein